MKIVFFILFVTLALPNFCQLSYEYFNINETPCREAEAVIYSETKATDTGFVVTDYFVYSKSPYRLKTYKDQGQNIKHGYFITYYPNGKIHSHEYYNNNKLQGKNVTFFESGLLLDSSFYENGKIVGTYFSWNSNGIIKDSIVFSKDEKPNLWVRWFDNGNPSMAGFFKGDLKAVTKVGTWQYFHKSGNISGKEVYDAYGYQKSAEYYNEDGGIETNSAIIFQKANFKNGWQEYLSKRLHFPENIELVNATRLDFLIEFDIDEMGKIKDIVILFPAHEKIHKFIKNIFLKSPLWTPERTENRAVKNHFIQQISIENPYYSD